LTPNDYSLISIDCALYTGIAMARKGKKRSAGRLQDDQYGQIISKSRPEAEELLRKLGLLALPSDKAPYSRRLSAQAALVQKGVDTSSYFSAPDFSQLKEQERVVAYYARPDVQNEMYRYARGRYLTVLRNFKPMFSALQDPGDVLPLMFHYLKPKGNRWPSMHGTVLRHNEDGRTICDFVFEPDFKKSWSVAFGAARPIVQLFLRMGLPFFVKFSGGTSPHIIVPGEALATAGDKEIKQHEFRDSLYRFVTRRMSKPGLLDGANWQPSHFLRLAYSIHELGGKVSTPIKPEEFDSFNPSKARLEDVVVIENWWHIPEDAAERGREFVQQVMKNYPRLVQGADRPKPDHKWKPPEIPRKLRQIFDANWYAKVLANGQQILASAQGHTALDEDVGPTEASSLQEAPSGAMAKALAMLKRWDGAGLKTDLRAAADVFELDVAELRRQWRSPDRQPTRSPSVKGDNDRHPDPYHYEYYFRSEIQEMFYSHAAGRCFRVVASKAHFRLQQPSDIPLLAAYFESSNADWRGFECTRGIYNRTDNQIAMCDIGMEIDFSRSDYVSAVELAETLVTVLQKYEVFCFARFDGNEILEVIIPAEALPEQVDGQKTALQMHQIASGLNRGFRLMPEVSGNDCILIIQPYGYTRPAYSLNPKTGLACIVLLPEDLQAFSPEHAVPARVSVNRSWLDIPPHARLQTQRFLKYALSPNWQPEAGL
jgi:hypothetical protein